MQNFDIVKKCAAPESFRAKKIMADFDVNAEHVGEHFMGGIEFPDDWQIGVICGGSGTGKTIIAKEIFGDSVISDMTYTGKCVLDDMPKEMSCEDISKHFYSVGFGSVPSWLKPYSVLSTGEQMRVNIARAMMERDFIVFDEFTSVVDRQVAQTASIAINKAIRRINKKFVAVTCHHDILEWLQPDWVLDTDTMQSFFGHSPEHKSGMIFADVRGQNGESLASITI